MTSVSPLALAPESWHERCLPLHLDASEFLVNNTFYKDRMDSYNCHTFLKQK